MNIPAQALKDILVTGGFVSETDFEAAEKSAKDLKKSLSDILIFRGLIEEAALAKLVAEYYKLPYADIRNKVIPQEIIDLVPEKLARKYHLVPFAMTDKQIQVAMENPRDFEAIEYVRRQTGKEVQPFFSTGKDIIGAFSNYKRNIRADFEDIIQKNARAVAQVSDTPANQAATELPVVKILNTLLEYAFSERASDLHIETEEESVIVRFRVDGVLRDVVTLPKESESAIIARIKILSSLKIDEHRIPQDGRFKFQVDGQFIALRVSIIPGFYGENAVLRLLAETARPLSLEELGLSQENLEKVKQSIKEPHGMILVTGPTGSGKTTTLYSVLNTLNTTEVKICTIEDPVEYGIARINQIQVNTQTGLTFAKGLRALLRHDPDIIMVGEIRDQETAEIAIHSALTGHLVLSTLHTNDAPSAIPRFLDMGAEPYLVSSTVNIIIAQRLVRKICQNCIIEYAPSPEVIKHLGQQLNQKVIDQKFYKGKGCEECGKSGYKGRIGIYEVFQMSEEIKALTIKRVSSDVIRAAAIKEGMTSIFQDGMDKIASGITTIEEVLRVVRE